MNMHFNGIELATILDEVVSLIREHIALTEDQAVTVALWIAHCHVHDAANCSPILAIQSPTMRSGKTSLLEIVEQLVPRGNLVSHASVAAIYRFKGQKPTLLLDEADRYIRHTNGDLIAVLNAGHRRDSSKILRTAETRRAGVKTFMPDVLDAWYPKAIASIGPLPDTVQDRSIVIHLLRKRPDQQTRKVGPQCRNKAVKLNAQLGRWAAEKIRKIETLLTAHNVTDLFLDDRAADNWDLMLGIADMAGVVWKDRARAAARTISQQTRDGDQASDVEALLSQIRLVFQGQQCETISAEELAGELVDLDGRPLSAKRLASLLKPFGIASRKTRDCNIYRYADFEDVFARYLPPISKGAEDGDLDDYSDVPF
jgi:putative DNA primase/helicase